jgi:hypothetical protein
VTPASNTQHNVISIISRCDTCKQHTTHQHHFSLQQKKKKKDSGEKKCEIQMKKKWSENEA